MAVDVFKALVEAAARGEAAALVTVVATSGSTPQRVGAKMVVFRDGRTLGTIGGGCYEHDAAQKAREALATGRPELLHYSLADELAADTGLICGGQMEVFVEPIRQPARLYIAGAGHVSVELARLASSVDFAVTVVDDRERFANRERFPAAAVVVDEIPAWFEAQELPPDGYFAVVTRGHRQDLETVRALIGRPWIYLGLIGSRAKVLKVMDALAQEGVPRERLEALHAPIGLDIGAVTPTVPPPARHGRGGSPRRTLPRARSARASPALLVERAAVRAKDPCQSCIMVLSTL